VHDLQVLVAARLFDTGEHIASRLYKSEETALSMTESPMGSGSIFVNGAFTV